MLLLYFGPKKHPVSHSYILYFCILLNNPHCCVQARDESHLEHLKPLLQLYRGSFLLIEFLSLMGLTMYCWRRSGINHILILDLDPRCHLSHHHVLEVMSSVLRPAESVITKTSRWYIFLFIAGDRILGCMLLY